MLSIRSDEVPNADHVEGVEVQSATAERFPERRIIFYPKTKSSGSLSEAEYLIFVIGAVSNSNYNCIVTKVMVSLGKSPVHICSIVLDSRQPENTYENRRSRITSMKILTWGIQVSSRNSQMIGFLMLICFPLLPH